MIHANEIKTAFANMMRLAARDPLWAIVALITFPRPLLRRAACRSTTSAAVSTNTIVRFERGEDLKPRTIAAIRTVLEEAGVIFLDGDYSGVGGPGIRLKAME